MPDIGGLDPAPRLSCDIVKHLNPLPRLLAEPGYFPPGRKPHPDIRVVRTH